MPRGHAFELQPGVWFEETWGAWLHIREDGDGFLLLDSAPRKLIQDEMAGYSASGTGIGARIYSADTQDISTLQVYVGASDEPDAFRRVDLPTLTDQEIRHLQGEYWSDELGALYRITAGSDSDTLLLTRRGHDPATIHFVGADTFVHGFFVNQISLAFARDDHDGVRGFALSSLRTRNIRFRRISGSDTL